MKASFEKAYWKLEPHLPEDLRDLASSTLRSVALNYIHRRGLKPPQSLEAIYQLKKRDDIVITRPGKGSGVFVMDKAEYLRLQADPSINHAAKFRFVDPVRPATRSASGPPKCYHPLLKKEKELNSLILRILPIAVADSI